MACAMHLSQKADNSDVAAFAQPTYNKPSVNTVLRIKDMPNQERPRERLVEKGADALKDSELIAILLRTGMKGQSAIQIGEQILKKFGFFENLASAALDDIRQIKGVGRDKAIALKAAFTLA